MNPDPSSQKSEDSKKEEEKEVSCISCHQNVKIKPIPFEDGFIADCPNCKALAYNSMEVK